MTKASYMVLFCHKNKPTPLRVSWKQLALPHRNSQDMQCNNSHLENPSCQILVCFCCSPTELFVRFYHISILLRDWKILAYVQCTLFIDTRMSGLKNYFALPRKIMKSSLFSEAEQNDRFFLEQENYSFK